MFALKTGYLRGFADELVLLLTLFLTTASCFRAKRQGSNGSLASSIFCGIDLLCMRRDADVFSRSCRRILSRLGTRLDGTTYMAGV